MMTSATALAYEFVVPLMIGSKDEIQEAQNEEEAAEIENHKYLRQFVSAQVAAVRRSVLLTFPVLVPPSFLGCGRVRANQCLLVSLPSSVYVAWSIDGGSHRPNLAVAWEPFLLPVPSDSVDHAGERNKLGRGRANPHIQLDLRLHQLPLPPGERVDRRFALLWAD